MKVCILFIAVFLSACGRVQWPEIEAANALCAKNGGVDYLDFRGLRVDAGCNNGAVFFDVVEAVRGE